MILAVLARGLLSKRQSQIAWAVISDSWAHFRRGADEWQYNWTRDPMPVARICRLTGLNKAHVSPELQLMIQRFQILTASSLQDHQIRLSFNEHFEYWTVTKTVTLPKQQRYRNGNPELPKEQRFVTETVTQYNMYARASSPTLRTTKNKRSVARAKTARDAVWDHFVLHYRTAYGEDPIRADRFFVNLARIRKAPRTDAQICEKINHLFAWNPQWQAGRWTFDDLVKHYGKIPKPGENGSGNRNETATERILRQSREREAELVDNQSAPPAGE